ncbi:MAG TPA: arsenical pump-driving ATPase [Propionibacteriaceae bacterium]|nr:arsenical pump-driving ATPase [Propionibacteriaceae bacterium]
MRFLEDVPRFVFFTGKGGVGKTSLACATALHLAETGRRVLLVSTDPASNLGQVFEQRIGNSITAITGVSGLDALEIDPDSAAEQYRERIIGPVRGLLPQAEIDAVTEQLSGSCTTEIASFDEFTGFLGQDASASAYDHVLFDTAPTGHTIRLLKLPGDWTGFIDAGGEASCLGPMSGLEKQRDQYARAVAALTDPDRTRLVLVARPQTTSLAEAARTAEELSEIGIHPTHLVVNALLPNEPVTDPLADAVRIREASALAGLPHPLQLMPSDLVSLAPRNMIGLEALRTLFTETAAGPTESSAEDVPQLPPLEALVEELAAAGRGLVMCVGKGGVGKTTIAAAIALGLAERGNTVHLTTTDPAAHLDATITETAGLPTLTISRIDPVRAIADYRESVLATRGKGLDAEGRAALAEDLMSPCNQEIAVFRQFSHLVVRAREEFVVVDTAPTGHTLLLMDTTGAYHRDLARSVAPGVRYTTPLMRLQDPDYTRIIMVTLAEPTPVLEALQFRDDLARAGITPWAWVVNQSLSAARPSSPLLRQRAALESGPIASVTDVATRVAAVPLLVDEPVGAERLRTVASGAMPTRPTSDRRDLARETS